jgi:arsenate reductase-like glutaredoxin family protein
MQKIIFVFTLLLLTTAFVGNRQKAENLVIVFTQNNCEPCENAVGLLESEGFEVDERNISQFKLYKKELLAKLKTIGWNNPKLPVMPVVETETKLYTNGEKAVAEILEQSGKSGNDNQTANNSTTIDPTPAVTGGDTEPAEMKGMVARHNYWRAQLGLPGLVWSNKMAQLAQDWANQLAKRGCEMQHRPSNKFGENIYWCSGFKATPQAVADSWADERKDFNFTTLECNGEWYKCGHYTQLIWETTTSVGCGMATCGNQQIWVCNYDPPGNWTGQKPYKKK